MSIVTLKPRLKKTSIPLTRHHLQMEIDNALHGKPLNPVHIKAFNIIIHDCFESAATNIKSVQLDRMFEYYSYAQVREAVSDLIATKMVVFASGRNLDESKPDDSERIIGILQTHPAANTSKWLYEVEVPTCTM